jgi:hypothetical protein
LYADLALPTKYGGIMRNKHIKRVSIASVAAIAGLILGYSMMQTKPIVKNNMVKAVPDTLLVKTNETGLTQSDLDSVSSEINEELASLRNQINMLNSNQQALQTDIENLPLMFDESDIKDDQDVKVDDEFQLSTTSPMPIEQKVQVQQELLEQTFYEQEPDPEWANETLAALYSSFESEEMQGIHLVEASCASTLCQMDLAIGQDALMEESLQHLAHHRSWDGATFVAANKNGQIKIYFARDGHDLPNPDAGEPIQQ